MITVVRVVTIYLYWIIHVLVMFLEIIKRLYFGFANAFEVNFFGSNLEMYKKKYFGIIMIIIREVYMIGLHSPVSRDLRFNKITSKGFLQI